MLDTLLTWHFQIRSLPIFGIYCSIPVYFYTTHICNIIIILPYSYLAYSLTLAHWLTGLKSLSVLFPSSLSGKASSPRETSHSLPTLLFHFLFPKLLILSFLRGHPHVSLLHCLSLIQVLSSIILCVWLFLSVVSSPPVMGRRRKSLSRLSGPQSQRSSLLPIEREEKEEEGSTWEEGDGGQFNSCGCITRKWKETACRLGLRDCCLSRPACDAACAFPACCLQKFSLSFHRKALSGRLYLTSVAASCLDLSAFISLSQVPACLATCCHCHAFLCCTCLVVILSSLSFLCLCIFVCVYFVCIVPCIFVLWLCLFACHVPLFALHFACAGWVGVGWWGVGCVTQSLTRPGTSNHHLFPRPLCIKSTPG